MNKSSNSYSPSTKHLLSALLCFVITIGISGLYMKGLMYEPNQHAPTFGGDGLTIHYNLQYHATYGAGTALRSQYYPHSETIFMTDAQGLLACTLSKLRKYFPSLPAYSVGISNFLIYWSNGLAAILIFLCLGKLKVNSRLSILFAVLIALLAPQIHRQTCGHYALGYAFILPAVFYFLLHRNISWSYFIKAILLTVILILLGLNNPYLLAISCSMLLACAGVGLLAYFLGHQLQFKVILAWLAVAIVSLLVTQGILHSLDEVPDRVKVPFGFFENIASFKGLFFPDNTWLSKPLSKIFSLGPNSFESRSFIGLIPLGVLLSLPYLWLRKKDFFKKLFQGNNLAVIFLASIAVLIFAFGEPFSIVKEWSTAHLGQVLQFRAPGRFSWVFYYAISFVTAYSISLVYERYASKNKAIVIMPLLIPIFLFWGFDAHQYLSWRTKGKIHHNAFSPDQLGPYYKLAADLSIDTTNYHGLFLLPTEHGWTDKVYHDGSWRSNYEGYRLSLASGLPLINGKLSRASVSHTLSSMQLVSNPLIKRELLDELSDEKFILVLKAAEAELQAGEETLLSDAEQIYSNKDFVLAKVNLRNLAEQTQKLRSDAQYHSGSQAQPIKYNHYEDDPELAYSGQGSLKLNAGKQTILRTALESESKNDTLNISLWYYADPAISGGPWWTAQSRANNKIVTELKKWSLDLTDTQHGWLRVEFLLPITNETEEVLIQSEYRHEAYIDELLIRRVNDTITYQSGGSFYFNNYLIQ